MSEPNRHAEWLRVFADEPRAATMAKTFPEKCRAAADHIDSIESKLDAQQWIALTPEQLPAKGRVVLCYTPSKNARFPIFSSYRHEEKFKTDWANFWTEAPVHRVTHWMPLPEPPK